MARDQSLEAASAHHPRPYRPLIIRIGLLLIVLAFAAWLRRPDGNLHLIFPEAPGDAILIETPRGEYVLIDGGTDPAMVAHTLGRRLPFWRRNLAIVVLTLPDPRHLAGQIAALQRYRAGR